MYWGGCRATLVYVNHKKPAERVAMSTIDVESLLQEISPDVPFPIAYSVAARKEYTRMQIVFD